MKHLLIPLSQAFLMTFAFLLCANTQAQVLLTQDRLDRWLTIGPDVRRLVDTYDLEDESDAFVLPTDGEAIIQMMESAVEEFLRYLKPEEMLAHLEDIGALPEVKGMVKGAGYPSIQSWAEDTKSIALAYIIIDSEGEGMSPEEFVSHMETTLQMPDFTEDEKSSIRSLIANVKKVIKVFNAVPPENIALVRPYMTQIKAVIDDPEDPENELDEGLY